MNRMLALTLVLVVAMLACSLPSAPGTAEPPIDLPPATEPAELPPPATEPPMPDPLVVLHDPRFPDILSGDKEAPHA